MPKIVEGTGKGQSADEPQRFGVAGTQVTCSHCGGDLFERRRAVVPVQGMTFMGLAFVNRSADAFACTACGHLEWFLDSASPA